MRATALLFIAVLAAGAFLSGQAADFSGTWVGDTMVPNASEKDSVTLVLKKAGASYAGTLTDSMGMADQTVLQNVKLDGNSLSFDFEISVDGQPLTVRVALKLTKDRLTGSWDTADGSTGPLELARKV